MADSSSASSTSASADPDQFELLIHLRWGDMDSLAHVNNVQVARLFEEARVRAFAEWFGARRENISMLVARQDIEYHSPLAYTPEPVRILGRVSRIGTASFQFGYTLVDPTGTTCAVAQTTLVVIDANSGRPTPIPDPIRAILEEHHGAPVKFRH
ncbi:acyl-CoA thioesterase [Gordonia sp. CPCC 205333]|uniref:acyl-CoA thioesterase n=1 Tax=Gordonia sp. CPCC 205333 TaxID=3140790 RepID=UPI003AF3B099